MKTKLTYTCTNCCKKVDYIAPDSALCDKCKASLPTAKFNSRIKKKEE